MADAAAPGYNMSNLNYGAGLGGIGSGLFDLFGHQPNPFDSANQYYSQISQQANQYNQPYYQAGVNQLQGLGDQYNQLMNNPGQKYNQMGESFQQSPGYQFQLNQGLGAQQRALAASGMAGSPMHEQMAQQMGNDMANQDYYNYMGGVTGLYGQGLGGAQNMAGMGQQAGNSMADMIAQQLAAQGQAAYGSTMYKNQKTSNAFGNLFGGIGSLFTNK